MGTTANSVLDERLHKLIGDWIEEDVTDPIDADTDIVSTDLNKWDDSNNDTFIDYWVYVTEYANAGEDRLIYDYVTSGGTCSVRGLNFTDDGNNKATCRFYRYSYTVCQRAINDAIRELSSVLFREVDDRTLVTENSLWDGHLEDWTSATAMRFWVAKHASGALAKTTTAGSYRGARGTTSAKYTTGGANDYMYQTSDTNPRLLDLMGQTVSAYVWAKPQTVDEAFIEIYTLQADGTAQTLTSTTACPAGKWTFLKLEDQTLNDDLITVEIRLKVAGSVEYAYFDNARVIGKTIHEYMLPDSFQDGSIAQVYIQRSSYSDEPCDDLMPETWDRVFNYDIKSDDTYKFLYLPYTYGSNRQIRLIGTSPLTPFSTPTSVASAIVVFADTVEISGGQVNLLLAYAAYCLFRNEENGVSSEDTSRYRSRAQQWLREYYRLLPSLKMIPPHGTLKLPIK